MKEQMKVQMKERKNNQNKMQEKNLFMKREIDIKYIFEDNVDVE